MFEQKQNGETELIDISNNQCTFTVNKCGSIQRLIMALRYYQMLKIELNTNDMEIMTSFINTVYKHTILIQDFYHLIKCHDEQIFDIKNVDGGLIGGASLNAKDFIDIVNSIN